MASSSELGLSNALTAFLFDSRLISGREVHGCIRGHCLCIAPVNVLSGPACSFRLLAASPLLAQNAEISGLISDPSSLAVAGARVVVQSVDTSATRVVSSNGQGEYSVPALAPGPYNITVEANGFKTVHQNGVVVEVDQRARLDFALTVGSNAESITVEGIAPLLNTSDASVSTVIDHQFVENLPLNGRSFSSLIDLTPGVVLIAVQSVRAGPVQREWPASGCQLLHWWME